MNKDRLLNSIINVYSQVVLKKTMEEWLRFSVCFWHTFRGTGSKNFLLGITSSKPTLAVDNLDVDLVSTNCSLLSTYLTKHTIFQF